jgi:hypothetical protein
MFYLIKGNKMKTLFDVNLSLKLSPPKYPKGVEFIKRIVLQRLNVTYSTTHQVRQLNVDQKRVPEIKDSFLVRGWVHSEPVPTIKIDPNNKNRFVGRSGWHRDAAAAAAGWDTMIYDVLEFDSPLDERIHMNSTNPAGLPYVPVTKADLIKQVKEAVSNKEIPNEDGEIRKFISLIASHQTEEYQNNILAKFRQHIGHSATLLVYRTQGSGEGTTRHYAETFNLPFQGDLFYNRTKRLGYITSETTPKTALFEAHKLFRQHKGKKVEFYAFIDKPIENPKLNEQRAEYKRKFDSFILDDCLSIQFEIMQLGYNISIEEIRKMHPVVFVGFLHQDVSPNPNDSGNPIEYGIVDVNGNKIKCLPKSINNLETVSQQELLGTFETMPSKLLDLLTT